MITTKPMSASKMLGSRLAQLFDKEQIIEMLGMMEEKDEEFWLTQKRTVSMRFYTFLLDALKMPLTTERETLSVEQVAHLSMLAGHLMHHGLTYKDVRDWWQHEGAYLHKKQFAAKRERERAENHCIKVLFLFEDQKPKFLTYSFVMDLESDVLGSLQPDDLPNLAGIRVPRLVEVAEERDAHEFPVYSLSELTKQSLLEQAKSFETLRKVLGAKEVKLLVKQKASQTDA